MRIPVPEWKGETVMQHDSSLKPEAEEQHLRPPSLEDIAIFWGAYLNALPPFVFMQVCMELWVFSPGKPAEHKGF